MAREKSAKWRGSLNVCLSVILESFREIKSGATVSQVSGGPEKKIFVPAYRMNMDELHAGVDRAAIGNKIIPDHANLARVVQA